jgi:hypothetical protein
VFPGAGDITTDDRVGDGGIISPLVPGVPVHPASDIPRTRRKEHTSTASAVFSMGKNCSPMVLNLAINAGFFAGMKNGRNTSVSGMKNRDYQSFTIASAFRFPGISSMAYRSAVRGITLLFFIT